MSDIVCLCPIFGNGFMVEEYSRVLKNWSENKYIDFHSYILKVSYY